MKKALITGITGQDGAYLGELLLAKGYEVHGIKRRTSLFNTDRIDHLYQDPHTADARFILHYGDMTDSSSLVRVIQQVQPDEIYNLAAQSHVAVSFEEPEYTADSDALGALRLLEAIRILGLERTTRFYQASTSELFGKVRETPQRETTPFYPRSPYAAAKLYAYWITVNYREAYGCYACNGILFNHECIAPDTPLIIRRGTIIDILCVRDLVALQRKGPNSRFFEIPDLEVWDGKGWTRVTGITATKRRREDPEHALLGIETRAGVVCTTAHHTLIDTEENTVKAAEVSPGARLLLCETLPEPPEWSSMTREMAEFLGLMTADGYLPGEGSRVQFTNNDTALQARVAELWSRLFLGCSHPYSGVSGFSGNSVGQLYLTGGTAHTRWLRDQLYDKRGYKKVPPLVLNASVEVQSAYLKGYYRGDGLKAGNGDSIKTNSPVLAQGILWLYAVQGRTCSTYVERRNGRSYYQLNIATANPKGEKGQHLRLDAAQVRRVVAVEPDDEDWVFDLETGSGRFLAGVGKIVVHNSPIRGETFVTRKITRALARVALGLQDCLYLGNLDARRDWGHARDYVEMMWLMLQQETPEDYVIASGEQHSVREFVELAARGLGIGLRWEGSGREETGIVETVDPAGRYEPPPSLAPGAVIVRVDPRYFRPTEVETLLGDPTKAREKLGWRPQVPFRDLVREMIDADFELARRDELCRSAGFTVPDRHE